MNTRRAFSRMAPDPVGTLQRRRCIFSGFSLLLALAFSIAAPLCSGSAQELPVPEPFNSSPGGDTCSPTTKQAVDAFIDRAEALKAERESILQKLGRGSREDYLRTIERLKSIDEELVELRRLLNELASALRKTLDDLLRCSGPRALTAGKWLLGIVLLPDPTDVLIWVVLGTPLGDAEPLSCIKVKSRSEPLAIEVARLCTEEIIERYGYPVSCLLKDPPCLACRDVLALLLEYRDFWDQYCADNRSPEERAKGEDFLRSIPNRGGAR
jgi:hypothetical protein